AIGLRRIRARASGRITCASDVTLIGGSADDGVAARADPALAGVGLRAGNGVGAAGAIGLRGVRARAIGRITCASDVTLIGGSADDGVAARAHPALAGVGLRAGIAVVAAGAIGLRGVRARAIGRITCASDVTLIGGAADDGVAAGADPALAGVGLRAGVAVVAVVVIG